MSAAATAATSPPSKARNYSSQFQHQLPNNEKSRQFRHNHPSTPQVAAASRYASSRGTPVDEENNNSYVLEGGRGGGGGGHRGCSPPDGGVVDATDAMSDAGTYTIEEDDDHPNSGPQTGQSYLCPQYLKSYIDTKQ